MKELFEKPAGHKPGLEIREGEPRVHTVYAYIKVGQKHGQFDRIDRVLGIYTDREDALKSARLDDMVAAEEDVIVPLHVYERLEDLPEEIRKEVQENDRGTLMPEIEKKEGMIYAVLPNTDSTEERGEYFIWVLTTDPLLANKVARSNGPSGSHAKVIDLPLNTYPIEEGVSRANLRRDKDDQLTDKLYPDK